MIDTTTIMLYTIGATAIIAAPGPDFIYVITRGIAQGKKAGIMSAVGISFGLIVHTLLAVLGLSALLQTSGLAFEIVKYIGAAYLVYIGISSLLSKKSLVEKRENTNNSATSSAIFRQGVITNVFNPKAVITFMTFIPQFINSTDSNATTQIIILGSILASLAILWFGIVGYFAGTFGQWLSKKVLVQRFIKWITGFILIGLGVRLALVKRN